MKTYIILPAMLFVALGIGEASATSKAEAIGLCGKNSNCRLFRMGSGVGLTIEGNAGGDVWCPDKGECTCLTCRVGKQSGVTAVVLGSAKKPQDRGDNTLRNREWDRGDTGSPQLDNRGGANDPKK
ncbi:MAG: hypothetical protein CL535_14970 [Ahrensia sp.]|nr:hypothetical protein [Ahrensia sp.]|tara:strand:- start:87113 stop:87490 length:378 start_codon:yes stop_codon:yes gene_type:complete